jgi:hypothetical protein
VPCLRRATALNYTDADEDAEKLMSFLDEVCTSFIRKELGLTISQADEAVGPDGKPRSGEDDWVATHIGRSKYRFNIHFSKSRSELIPQHLTQTLQSTISQICPTLHLSLVAQTHQAQ